MRCLTFFFLFCTVTAYAQQAGSYNLGTRGTTTNNDATAGDVGEYKVGQSIPGAAVALSTGTTKNVGVTVTLTPGDWDVTGAVDYILSGATVTEIESGSSTNSNSRGAQDAYAMQAMNLVTTSGTHTGVLPTFRYSLSGTSTIYLVAEATFSAGTVSAYGTIRARRVR